MFMQIYANGLGVPRNLDLATAYACQIEGAPAGVGIGGGSRGILRGARNVAFTSEIRVGRRHLPRYR
jgi:hypothetical protein